MVPHGFIVQTKRIIDHYLLHHIHEHSVLVKGKNPNCLSKVTMSYPKEKYYALTAMSADRLQN